MSSNTITALSDTLGTARLIGKFANQSLEWHALRATGIGGSDVGTITRCNPWSSPFALWARRTGRIADDAVTSEAAEWGTRLESVVLDKFAEEHPELVVHRDCGTWRHAEREWQLANPDAIYETADGTYGVVEVKTARYEDDWADGVPASYRAQVQWYLATFGLDHAYVVALFSGSKYREFEVKADQFEQDTNLAEVEKFRVYLDEDKQPDYDGALSTYTAIREMHPSIDTEAEVELGTLGIEYSKALDQFSSAESHLNEMKSRVLDAMGDAKRGLVEDIWFVTRQARNGGTPYLVNKKK